MDALQKLGWNYTAEFNPENGFNQEISLRWKNGKRYINIVFSEKRKNCYIDVYTWSIFGKFAGYLNISELNALNKTVNDFYKQLKQGEK